jgi:starvation-inducible DNA-binding protein
MHFTHNTLKLLVREKSANILTRHLAAAIDLQGQIKQAHWNVRGTGFIAIHELFDKSAGPVSENADALAERTAALGGTAEGTIQVAAGNSFLVPYPLKTADVSKHIFAVSAALAAFGQSAREASAEVAASGDADTADLFTQISRGTDAQLWLVESHVTPAD